jgi:hypothetical protein
MEKHSIFKGEGVKRMSKAMRDAPSVEDIVFYRLDSVLGARITKKGKFFIHGKEVFYPQVDGEKLYDDMMSLIVDEVI